jgi:nucleoside-diphosphate-sugar epimerase
LEVFRGQEEGLHIDVVNPSVILAPSNERRSSAQLFHYVKKQRLFYTSSSINFVDVRDVVDLIFKLIDQPPTGKRFIVNGGTVEIKHLFDAIATRLGKRPPKVKLGPNMLHLIATLESIRSGLTGSDPLISRQSIKSSLDRFEYSSLRAVQDLGMQFRPLNETLDWCCPHYANAYNKQSNPAS